MSGRPIRGSLFVKKYRSSADFCPNSVTFSITRGKSPDGPPADSRRGRRPDRGLRRPQARHQRGRHQQGRHARDHAPRRGLRGWPILRPRILQEQDGHVRLRRAPRVRRHRLAPLLRRGGPQHRGRHAHHPLPPRPLRRGPVRRGPNQLQRQNLDDPPDESDLRHAHARLRQAQQTERELRSSLRREGRRGVHEAHRGHRLSPGDGHRRDQGDALPSGARPRRVHVLRRHRRTTSAVHRRLLPHAGQALTRRGPTPGPAARRHRRGHVRRVTALPAGGTRTKIHGYGAQGADPRGQGPPPRRRPRPRAGGAADPGGLLGQAPRVEGRAHIPGIRAG